TPAAPRDGGAPPPPGRSAQRCRCSSGSPARRGRRGGWARSCPDTIGRPGTWCCRTGLGDPGEPSAPAHRAGRGGSSGICEPTKGGSGLFGGGRRGTGELAALVSLHPPLDLTAVQTEAQQPEELGHSGFGGHIVSTDDADLTQPREIKAQVHTTPQA